MAELTSLKNNHQNYGTEVGEDNKGFEQTEEDEISKPNSNGKMENMEISTGNVVSSNRGTMCSRAMTGFRRTLFKFYTKYDSQITNAIKFVLLMLYLGYFGYAMYYRFGDEGSMRLLVCTIIGMVLLGINLIGKIFKDNLNSIWTRHCKTILVSPGFRKFLQYFNWVFLLCVYGGVFGFVIYDVAIDHPENLVSVAGLLIYVLLFYIFSKDPSKINWRPVLWGIAIQYVFALLILRTYWGFKAFEWLGDRATEFLSYSDEGAKFVFGDAYTNHYFAFKVLPVVIFFYTVISVLYYLGVMQIIIRYIGQFLAFSLGTTPGESLNAAGNIFIGMTEAPLMIQPFLKDMTKSELHAVMTGGFATIAGSVLGAYISFGVPANHLLSASVMSAPAALAVSKLLYPEVEVPKISSKDFSRMGKSTERNFIEAIATGADKSIKVVASIAVNIIAFLCILKFVNVTLTWFGDRVGVEDLTFQTICSYVFFPIAFFMGVESDDCRKVGELIGIKTFTNEFVAYKELSVLIENKKNFTAYTSTMWNDSAADWYYRGSDIILPFVNQTLKEGLISDKSEVIATYALCGFSNFGSMGMFLGGMCALVPSRKSDLSKIVLSAMIAGNVACFLTGCVAGLLYKDYDKT